MPENIKRVYLETRFFGGSGGSEKHAKAIINLFPKNIKIDINVTMVNSEENFKRKNVIFINEPSGNYDVAIRLCDGKMNKNVISKKKIIVTCGDDVSKSQYYYDLIWIESPSDDRETYKIRKFICPFIDEENYIPLKDNKVVIKFNKGYYVTVCNTYNKKVKGIDLIYKFSKKLDKPLIWFTSENKIGPINLLKKWKRNDNLVIIKNAPHNFILDTVKKSKAYISFSRSEGYGWSIAEAISLDIPVISRNVGIVSYFPELVNIYNNPKNIPSLVKQIDKRDYNYDKYHNLMGNSKKIFFDEVQYNYL